MNKQRLDCLRKVRYSTRKKATSAAMRFRDTLTWTDPLSPYQCDFCRGFHLTKQQPARRRSA